MKRMLNNKHVRELLPDYMAGNVSRWTAWKIRRHARNCSRCTAELNTYQTLSQSIRDEFSAQTVPASLLAKISDLIESADYRSRHRSKPVWRPAVVTVVVAALLAVTLVIVLEPWQSGSISGHGTVNVSVGNRLMLQGTFEHQSPEEWNQTMQGVGTGFAGDPQPFDLNPTAETEIGRAHV